MLRREKKKEAVVSESKPIAHCSKRRKKPCCPIIKWAGVSSFKAAPGVAPLPGTSIDASFFPSTMERNMPNQ